MPTYDVHVTALQRPATDLGGGRCARALETLAEVGRPVAAAERGRQQQGKRSDTKRALRHVDLRAGPAGMTLQPLCRERGGVDTAG